MAVEPKDIIEDIHTIITLKEQSRKVIISSIKTLWGAKDWDKNISRNPIDIYELEMLQTRYPHMKSRGAILYRLIKAYDNSPNLRNHVSLCKIERVKTEYNTIMACLKNTVPENEKAKQRTSTLNFQDLQIATNTDLENNPTDKQALVVRVYTELPSRLDFRYAKVLTRLDEGIIDKMNKLNQYKTMYGKKEITKDEYIKMEESLQIENYYNTQTGYFYICKHKTALTYGTLVLICSDELKGILQKYIDSNNIQHGDYLFTDRNGNIYKEYSYSRLISNAFKKYTGQVVSINDLRHKHATNDVVDFTTNTELTQKATQMGHSVDTHMRYRYAKDQQEALYVIVSKMKQQDVSYEEIIDVIQDVYNKSF